MATTPNPRLLTMARGKAAVCERLHSSGKGLGGLVSGDHGSIKTSRRWRDWVIRLVW